MRSRFSLVTRLAASLLLLSLAGPAFAATFTVTNNLDAGAGSFRQAMANANASAGPDVIQFNIPPGGPQTITVTDGGGLGVLTETVTIDGTTQPGYAGAPLIEFTGTTAFMSGLILTAHSNTVRGLVLNHFGTAITLSGGSSGNRLEGNWLGTDLTGALNRGNSTGIVIDGGADNVIGGTNTTARNVVSGSTNNAIYIVGGTRNVVLGNYIGTDAAGTNSFGNGWLANGAFTFSAGVFIEGGSTNTVGGTNAGAGNLISGNARGVVLYSHTAGNVIQGNVFGLNAAGNAVPPGLPQLAGIGIFTAENNLIGGTVPGARNVISGSYGGPFGSTEGYGIQMSSANFITIQGNFIGTDVTGTYGIANHSHGIALSGVSRTNTIGGTVTGARNVISGNRVNGIYFRDAFQNFIQGNYIGTQSDGVSPLGNGESGLFLFSGSGNSIGGTTAASGNVFAHNGTNTGAFYRNGVTLIQGDIFTSSAGNLIRRNSFFSHPGRGILLEGSTASPHNDAGDADSGANNLQNTPVLTNAVTSGGSIAISGTFNSTPSSAFTLEFFASPDINPTGFGEGKTYIGSGAVLTDGSGNTSFEFFFSDAGYAGKFISATATDAAKNTSEFAADVVADGPAGAVQFSQATYNQSESGSAIITVSRVAGTNGAITVNYSTSDGTAVAGSDYTNSSGVLNFAAGQVSQTFAVPIFNDTLNELNETVLLSLDTPTGGAVLGSLSNATLVILDNDPILLSVADAAATKPPTGTTTIQFPVTLSQASTRTVSVFYATADITAEAGTHYLTATGRVDLLPGNTSQPVSVTILADGEQDGSRQFLLTLSSPTNATFGDSQALGTIYDGTQGILQFSISNYVANETAGSATITVARVGGALGSVSVSFTTASGSAVSGSDFTPTNGVLSFSNGQTSRIFTVSILNDAAMEGPETLPLQLSNPSGTTLGLSAATLTISDDEPLPTLTIESVTAAARLHWPTQAADFQLVRSPVLLAPTWSVVTNAPATVGNEFVVTNQFNGSNEFFRLRR